MRRSLWPLWQAGTGANGQAAERRKRGISLQRKWKAKRQRQTGTCCNLQLMGCTQPKNTAYPTQITALHRSHYTPLLDPQQWVHPRGKKQNLMELMVPGSCSSRKPSQTGIFPTGSASSQARKQQILPLHLGPGKGFSYTALTCSAQVPSSFPWVPASVPPAFPGEHGGHIRTRLGAPEFPYHNPSRHPLLPSRRQTPSSPGPASAQLHRRSETYQRAFSTDSFSAFPSYFFFFLKAQPQPCTQQKPRASSSPHPGTGPKNSLLPPSSQKLTAQGTLQRKLPSLNTALPTFALLARLASAGPSLLLIPLAAGRAPLSEPERNQQEKAPEGFQQLSK